MFGRFSDGTRKPHLGKGMLESLAANSGALRIESLYPVASLLCLRLDRKHCGLLVVAGHISSNLSVCLVCLLPCRPPDGTGAQPIAVKRHWLLPAETELNRRDYSIDKTFAGMELNALLYPCETGYCISIRSFYEEDLRDCRSVNLRVGGCQRSWKKGFRCRCCGLSPD